MHRILRWWLIATAASALIAGVGVLLWPKEDPCRLVLGEWSEKSARVRVEVLPAEVKWRGAGHGRLSYEWLQTEESPYRVRLEYHGERVEADVWFTGEDRMIVQPDIWSKLPTQAREMLGELNRRHGRPEHEFRLLFCREHERK